MEDVLREETRVIERVFSNNPVVHREAMKRLVESLGDEINAIEDVAKMA